MSLKRGLTIALKLLAISLAALAMTGVVGAAAPAANSIYVHDQETNLGVITVDQVVAAEAGWVVVYKRADLTTDMIVGYAPVAKGANQGVRVTLEGKRMEDVKTLWIRLHVDLGKKGVFEWGYHGKGLSDPPAAENGQPVIAMLATAGYGAPLPLVPAISIKAQDLTDNQLFVDSVTTPVDGWLVIYKNANLKSSEIVGHVPVYHGTNTNLKVAIETWRLDKVITLYAALHEDKAAQKVLEVGHMGLTKGDPLLMYNGLPVVATFGTRAQ